MRSDKKNIPIAKAFVIALLVFLGVQVYRGGNAERFNLAMKQKAESNQLIGKTEKEVIAVLGPPSNRVVQPSGEFTLNYHPGLLVPIMKFQAHFGASGILRNIELMD